MLSLSITGRVTIVTGAGRGIGVAICAELARAGSAVAVLDLDGPSAEATAGEITREFGTPSHGYAADITDRAVLRDVIDRIARDFGGVDHLVNNAGVHFVHELATFPDEKWDWICRVDLDAVFNTTKAVWPLLKARGRGRIVNIASVQGLIATEYKSAYVTAKHGVIGLTRASALEGAPHDITVNAVCPGAVLTEMTKRQIPDLVRSYGGEISEEEAVMRSFLQRMPIRRFIAPEEVAMLVTYLCTDAARSITGAAIAIDGGWSAH